VRFTKRPYAVEVVFGGGQHPCYWHEPCPIASKQAKGAAIVAKKDLAKGWRAGLIAGFVALVAMDTFQGVYINLSVALSGAAPDGKPPRSRNPLRLGYQSQGGKGDNDANEVAASRAVKAVTGRELTYEQQQWAGPLSHYTFGTLLGGLYGLAAEYKPGLGTGNGLPLGAVFWLLQDEIAVPLSGNAYGPTRYPLGLHLYGLAGHLAFGLALEATRRAVRGR